MCRAGSSRAPSCFPGASLARSAGRPGQAASISAWSAATCGAAGGAGGALDGAEAA